MNDFQMKKQIKAERKRYEEDEEVIHNKDLHQYILETWRRDSPKMTQDLEELGILDDMAFVSQERMWRQMDEYLAGGMPVTDAREQAERDHLSLEPEEPEEDVTDLPPELQNAPRYMREKWRAEMERLGLTYEGARA